MGHAPQPAVTLRRLGPHAADHPVRAGCVVVSAVGAILTVACDRSLAADRPRFARPASRSLCVCVSSATPPSIAYRCRRRDHRPRGAPVDRVRVDAVKEYEREHRWDRCAGQRQRHVLQPLVLDVAPEESAQPGESGTRWSREPRNLSRPVSGFSGNTCPRVSRRQTAPRSSAVWTVWGREAMNAALNAPAEVPRRVPQRFRANDGEDGYDKLHLWGIL
jgi:hypothetical protein